jgi:molecular chaperone GrpE
MSKKADRKKKIDIEVSDGEPKSISETEEKPGAEYNSEAAGSGSENGGEKATAEAKTAEQINAEYEEKIRELNDRYLRLAAEFDNFKKRSARQYAELINSSGERLILMFLELADNFERALEAAEKSSDFAALQSGTEMIYQHLSDILKKEGVEPISAVGEKFDPDVHEALMQVASDEYPEGVVVQEIIRGFRLNGKVIRFARVAVSGGKAADTANNDDNSEEQPK